MIDEATIRKVKDAASIVDVIGDFYQLGRDGVNYTCLCPFHDDRSLGNFKISPRRNMYKCFACNASGGPVDFLMEHEGLSFPDAIRWLGKKYVIDVEGADKFTAVKPSKPRELQTLPDNLPTLTIPMWMMRHTMENAGESTLVRWLRSLPWDEVQRERIDKTLKNYFVGCSKEGHTIFWQVDELGYVRTGKMMHYKSDGHRDKDKGRSWIHAKLKRVGKFDDTKYTMRQTLYGMHLLDMCPNATVNIVESEKTALIMTIAYGDMRRCVWMATGGVCNLNEKVLKPIIERGRKVVLYPDKDAAECWREIAKGIAYDGMTLNTGFLDSIWIADDGDKADVADCIVRLLKGEPLKGINDIGDVVRQYPQLEVLVDKLDLELVNISKINIMNYE